MCRWCLPLVLLIGLTCVDVAQGEPLDIATVSIGNLGNAPELSGIAAGGEGPTRPCGYVDHAYRIGLFEITAGQYTAFLNAVAAADTYHLYNTAMASDVHGCRILRAGSTGSYTYTVAADWADRPVNLVSWGDAARFCNWLHNGQPSGVQDSTTTEDGSYALDGAFGDSALMLVTRRANATWVLPTEDEWYKAAYHTNDGPTGTYHDFPTSADAVPFNQWLTPDPGNSANFVVDDYAVGGPYYRTPGGAFGNSASPYGTFDQGGNVWEWNETAVSGSERGVRGGSFSSYSNRLHAATRSFGRPTQESVGIGFRVGWVGALDEIPATSTWGVGLLVLTILTAGTLAIRNGTAFEHAN